MQILCTLRNVKSFVGVYSSDLIPHSIIESSCLILNTDPHTEKGTHWLAIYLQPKSYSAYYFDSYALPPFLPTVRDFLRRNCSIWTYNKVQLQGDTSAVCGHYCCLFALYMDRGYTPQQFVNIFDSKKADTQILKMFASEFEPLRKDVCGGQCCVNRYKRYVFYIIFFIYLLHLIRNGSNN